MKGGLCTILRRWLPRGNIEVLGRFKLGMDLSEGHSFPFLVKEFVENHRIFLEYPLIYSLHFLYNIFPSFLYLIYFLFMSS